MFPGKNWRWARYVPAAGLMVCLLLWIAVLKHSSLTSCHDTASTLRRPLHRRLPAVGLMQEGSAHPPSGAFELALELQQLEDALTSVGVSDAAQYRSLQASFAAFRARLLLTAPTLQQEVAEVAKSAQDAGRMQPSQLYRRPYTQQTCYLQIDDSELCVYDNVLCFDGESLIVSVEQPTEEVDRIDDYSVLCSDFRYYDAATIEDTGCQATVVSSRKIQPAQWDGWAPASQSSLAMRARRWGPQNRAADLWFHEEKAEDLLGHRLLGQLLQRPEHDRLLPYDFLEPVGQLPVSHKGGSGSSSSSGKSSSRSAGEDVGGTRAGTTGDDAAAEEAATAERGAAVIKHQVGRNGVRMEALLREAERKAADQKAALERLLHGQAGEAASQPQGQRQQEKQREREKASPPWRYSQHFSNALDAALADPKRTPLPGAFPLLTREVVEAPLRKGQGNTPPAAAAVVGAGSEGGASGGERQKLDEASSTASIEQQLQQLALQGKRKVVVDWLDGPLWITGLETGWAQNPFHFLSKTAILFDAQRANKTGALHEDRLREWAAAGAALYAGQMGMGRPHYPSDKASHSSPEMAGASSSSSSSSSFLASASSSSSSMQAFSLGAGILHAAEDFGSHSGDAYIRPAMAWEASVAPTTSQTSPSSSQLKYRQGAQWDLPPMANVLFAGAGARETASVQKLKPWFKAMLQLSVQKETKVGMQDVLSSLSKDHLICARKGVVLGSKHRAFTGMSDAEVFKRRAYELAGLDHNTVHPAYPPRRITILDRRGDKYYDSRTIQNKRELLQAVRATGLPVQEIEDMASLSFEEQVRVMAGTSILIATHGAALANCIFLPAHAAVIELFPYKLMKTTYAAIAAVVGLQYFPVYAKQPLQASSFSSDATATAAAADHASSDSDGGNGNGDGGASDTISAVLTELQSESYIRECVQRNVSSVDSSINRHCLLASKNSPIVVPLQELQTALANALEATSAYSLDNPLWAEEVKQFPERAVPPRHKAVPLH